MIRNILKNVYYHGLGLSKFDKLKINYIYTQNKILVLNLHRISSEENPFWPPMKPEMFEELLKFLQKNFEVSLFKEIEEKASSKKPLAIISFDDGYYDFVEYACPLLEKYKMSANMNFIPQCVESGIPMWNIKLYDFLNSAPKNLINEIKLPNLDNLKNESRAEKIKYGLKLSRYLKLRPRTEREVLWKQIEPIFEKIDFKLTRMMNKEEIKEVSQQIEIGVHSYSHESMGYVDFDFFKEDFHLCQRYFAEVLQTDLDIYAFPNGSYKAEQLDFLRQSGIKRILLVDEDFSEKTTDVFKRITVYGDSKKEIIMKSLGF